MTARLGMALEHGDRIFECVASAPIPDGHGNAYVTLDLVEVDIPAEIEADPTWLENG